MKRKIGIFLDGKPDIELNTTKIERCELLVQASEYISNHLITNERNSCNTRI